MKKERIFSLLNIKDYNNELEKILAKKNFSMDTKNLLLSMSYKIENSYNDYEKVKQEVLSRNKYMEKLISIIKTKCYEFNTIMPSMPEFDELKDKKFVIDTEKGAITVIDNEYYALKAITKLPKIEWGILDEYGLLKAPFCKVLTLGSIMHELEVLRDFNGWSWNTNLKEIEDVQCNLIYQCLVYLFENQFLTEWIENKQGMIDYIAIAQNKLEKLYGKEFSDEIITLICKVIMEYGMNDKIIEKRNYLALIELAKFYEVTVDYLLGRSQTKNHPNADLADLRLSDDMIELLKSGRVDNSLLCELATHPDFPRLMADLEIYVNGVAGKQVQSANAIVDAVSATIMKQHNPGLTDPQLRQLIAAHIDDDSFCRYVIQQDINKIALDLREAHKDDFFSVPEDNPLEDFLQTAEETTSPDSDPEQAAMAFICKRLKLNYGKLSEEEKKWLKKIAQKSDLLKNPKPQRGRK